MAAELKPYPVYKDSGVPWLGEVPAHWEVPRIKTLCSMESGNGITAMSIEPTGEYPVYGGNGLRGYTSNYTHDGNFVLIGRQGALCGNVHLARGRFWASEHAVVATTHSGHSPEWLGATLGVMNLNQYSIAAAQPGLSVERVLNLRLPVPPLPEQTAIVRFLDYADRRIRRYIRAKQKLIALLEEQKQAIIHQAVTGQIDVRTGHPYPAYKPSGVEWLGEVPTHWEVSRVKTELHCLNHRRLPLSGTERGEMTLRRYDYYGASGVIDKVDDYLFDDELLLIAEDGANLVLRNLPLAIIARGKFWVNNHAHILKPKRGHLEYLAGVMEGLNYLPWISGAAQPKLTQDRLMSIAIAVPPREEQNRIVSFISTETSHLRIAIDRAHRETDLLHEYRTRLIADVVTGKLDVREAAATLPEVDPLADEDTLNDTLDTAAQSDLDEPNTTLEEVDA